MKTAEQGRGKNLLEKSEMKEPLLTSIVLITRNVKRHPVDKTAFELSITTLREKNAQFSTKKKKNCFCRKAMFYCLTNDVSSTMSDTT